MTKVLRILGLALLVDLLVVVHALPAGQNQTLKLLPYPKEIQRQTGDLQLGPAKYLEPRRPTDTEMAARESLDSYLPHDGRAVSVRLGSVEEGYVQDWLAPCDLEFLARPQTSSEASVLCIAEQGITVVGKGKWGLFYGVQTVNQLIRGSDTVQGVWRLNTSLPCLTIRDWPDLPWRCLSPQMTWYSGYNRLEGYDNGNWTLDEWKWLVDWSALHKCNGWALCMYGNWPFTLPGYDETTLDVDSYFLDPATGKKVPHRFTHRNIRREFLPELIRYANRRGVQVYAYIGKNSFNGTYGHKHPDANAGGAAELIPFHPGVHEYWEAVVRRIVEIGFNGFVFEDPEALHVPNQNAKCYETFWQPWAQTYGFKSVQETDQNNPPLGVQVEYYSWLFKVFDQMIQKFAAETGRPQEIFLISHVLLSRMVSESKTQAERDKWFAYIDEKQGRKARFIILEADEDKYVSFLGRERVASLGGRGGSCTNAMRRIASINNNWCNGGMGGDLAYERRCQQHIYEAGGFGAMGYIFEWTNTEVFGYLASQYLWRNAGVPGLDNDNQTDFLNYAYRMHYGDTVGSLVARVMDEGSCVNDAMMLEGVYGSQYPSTGAPLHRDFQYLSVQADRAVDLASQAYQAYVGNAPDLYKPVYVQEEFAWNGFELQANKSFNAERLRLLYVSTRRSQCMCRAVLAHRLAERLIAEGAAAGDVLARFDAALAAASENQRIYQLNYDDDYDWTDGLCARVTETLQSQRDQFVASLSSDTKAVQAWMFERPGEPEGWTEVHELSPPRVEQGALVSEASGSGPFVVQSQRLSVPVDERCFAELVIASNQGGRVRLFWATAADLAAQPADAYPFSEARVRSAEISASNEFKVCQIAPGWRGTLAKLRIDVPAKSRVRIDSIRIVRVPEAMSLTAGDLTRPVPELVRRSIANPLFIPWQKQHDIVPDSCRARQPGLYLSTDIGCDNKFDFYRLGVVFTVQAQTHDGQWQTVFRKDVARRTNAWEHWDIPVAPFASSAAGGDAASAESREAAAKNTRQVRLRFMTDSYSRAQDRSAPSWNWALWGEPQLVEVTADGTRQVKYDFVEHIDRAQPLVRLDRDGRERPFDRPSPDSTGATYQTVDPGIVARLQSNEGRSWQWIDGFERWAEQPRQRGAYRCYLGSVDSGWVYAHQNGELSWLTAPAPEKQPTAIAFVGGTGYGPGNAELWCDGKRLVEFRTSQAKDSSWEADGVELRYLHGGDTRNANTTFGISGVYVLRLPASFVTPGQPFHLVVKVPAVGGGDWFMVHEYHDVAAATATARIPAPSKPAIAAFTPHLDGQFGVTIAEYLVELVD
jgi:hypothetical protein